MLGTVSEASRADTLFRQFPGGLAMALHFDDWVEDEFGKGPFTVLIVLVDIGKASVEPLASSFLHVIGDEIDWSAMQVMLDKAPHPWNGAAFFPARLAEPGPISDALARLRLQDLQQQVAADRLTLNAGAFFDRLGRAIKIEAADGQTPSLH
jgi:hypothetical protein